MIKAYTLLKFAVMNIHLIVRFNIYPDKKLAIQIADTNSNQSNIQFCKAILKNWMLLLSVSKK
jgi:hypothetical protein